MKRKPMFKFKFPKGKFTKKQEAFYGRILMQEFEKSLIRECGSIEAFLAKAQAEAIKNLFRPKKWKKGMGDTIRGVKR